MGETQLFDMPDEEFEKRRMELMPSEPATDPEADAGPAAEADTREPPVDSTGETAEETAEASEEASEGATAEATAEETAEATAEETAEATAEETAEATFDATFDATAKETEPAAESDWKGLYQSLMGPMKAAGREFTPRSVEDARRLMQMGVDYARKMTAMKPARTALKTLENAGLLEGDALNLLIEAHQGKKEAIIELARRHKVDFEEVDPEETPDYRPGEHRADPRTVEIEQVLDDLKESPTLDRTLKVVANEWDAKSRTAFADNPRYLEVLNRQMEAGIYDKVAGYVAYERAFGRLAGLSDFEAYMAAGDALMKQGLLVPPVAAAAAAAAASPTPPPESAEKKNERSINKKKAAPQPAAGTGSSGVDPNFNPLDMDDEEFEQKFGKVLKGFGRR